MTVVVLTTTGAGTWTIPSGVKAGDTILVEDWGGGSGGSGSSASFRSGGAGPAYASDTYHVTAEDIAAGVINFTIGAGSAGTGAANPAAGGDTTWSTNAVNIVPNSALWGAVAGTPGTLPNGWTISNSVGASTQIVGFGTDATTGLRYIDFRVFATTPTAGAVALNMMPTGTAVSTSTTYVNSCYTELTATVHAASFYTFDFVNGSSFANYATGTPSTTGSLVRNSISGGTSTGTLGYTRIQFGTAASTAIDVTMRIAGIQLEVGSTATSWRPTPGLPIAKGGGAPSGTAGGTAGSTVNSAGNIVTAGGGGAGVAAGGGGGGAPGPDGTGATATTGTGGTGDGGNVAAGASDTRGGGGATAGTSPSTGGVPGGGGAGNTSVGNGSAGGGGQIRLTYTDATPPTRARQLGRGPRPIIPRPVRDYSTLTTDITAAPGAGSIVFTGQAPSPDADTQPSAGSVVFGGQAPNADVGGPPKAPARQLGRGPRPLLPRQVRDPGILTAFPPSGSVVFTGQAPSADEAVTPGAGSVLFTGLAPSADETVAPGAGAITFSGQTPTTDGGGPPKAPARQLGVGPRPLIPRAVRDYSTSTSDLAVAPGAGSILFAGQAPSADEAVAPAPGSIVFTGLAPSVDENVQPGSGSVVFTGLAPSADAAVLPGSGSVLFTGLAPSPDADTQPSAGSVVFTGLAPNVTGDITVTPGPGSLVFGGFAPTVDLGGAPVGGGDDETGADIRRRRWLDWNHQRWLAKQRDKATQRPTKTEPREEPPLAQPARPAPQKPAQPLPPSLRQPFDLPFQAPPAAPGARDDSALTEAAGRLAELRARAQQEEEDMAALLLMCP